MWNREVQDGSVGTLGDRIENWGAHVLRICREADLVDLHDPWGVHDFVAALYIRDAVERGLSSVSWEGEPPALVGAVDDLLRSASEPVPEGSLSIVHPDVPRMPWWWQLQPRRGPIREELDSIRRLLSGGPKLP